MAACLPVSLSSTQEQTVPFELKRETSIPLFIRPFHLSAESSDNLSRIEPLQMDCLWALQEGSLSSAVWPKPWTGLIFSRQQSFSSRASPPEYHSFRAGLVRSISARSVEAPLRHPAGPLCENLQFSYRVPAGPRIQKLPEAFAPLHFQEGEIRSCLQSVKDGSFRSPPVSAYCPVREPWPIRYGSKTGIS